MPGVTPYRILVIDDNAAIHDDFRKVLGTPVVDGNSGVADLEAALFDECEAAATGPTYEIDTALQGREGLDKVRQARADGRPYAMVFVDMRMPPGWDGVQTLREIWRIEPTLQAAVCTAYSDYSPEQITRELSRAGKMLIVRKPFEAAEIRQLTEMLCRKWELEQQVLARAAELEQAVLHDSLTGLPNRKMLADRLEWALALKRRRPEFQFAVMLLNCDNFKSVNDTHGHQAGDELLQQVAARVRRTLRHSDIVLQPEDSMTARVGGDEFAVLLLNIRNEADARQVAERLLDATAAHYGIAGRTIRCATSIGIATGSVPYANAGEILRDADAAMHESKRLGGSQYVLFDQNKHDEFVTRIGIEHELRDAVANGHVVPFYQPILRAADRKLVGFEALARWHHPTRGLLMPGQFIPLAEQSGVIIDLGAKIFEDACDQLAKWDKQFPAGLPLTMGINLSRKQLVDPNLASKFKAILDRTGVAPNRVHVEVTESTVMEDAAKSIATLNQLRAMNLKLQMDDFGSGYSSLSCLYQLPLNGLKVDRSFVSDLSPEGGAHPVLNAIQALASGMKLPVVAEGVETEAQYQKVRDIGYTYVQGYLFGKPLEASAATTLIAGGTIPVEKAA